MNKESKKWLTPEVSQLFEVVLTLETQEEVKNFFRDLLTEKELAEFSLRWKVAQMLNQGVSYTEIVKETGMSSTTVARISKWLSNGMGGYKSMLSKMHHHYVPQSTRLNET